MRFRSTRQQAPRVDLADALRAGLAPDGGLYVPEQFVAPPGSLRPLPMLAAQALAPYAAGTALATELPALCAAAFDFELPIQALGAHVAVAELFHGPTAAFKDYGARFLAGALSALRASDEPERCIVVATSGDTGGAVAAAFAERPGFRVLILYPDGRVSPRQAHQLACWPDNIRTLAVAGDFDDCQRLAKTLLARGQVGGLRLSSANSISIGRLLPQYSYAVYLALEAERRFGRSAEFIVPTGNLGNAYGAILAQRLGAPIARVVLATNANPTLAEFHDGAPYQPRAAIATLANAMDVGAPSNFERLRDLFGGDDESQRNAVPVIAVDDDAIRDAIRRAHREHGYLICPHTATAVVAAERRREAGSSAPQLLYATAHPAKFDTVVEPLLGQTVPVPPALAALLARPSRAIRVENEIDAVIAAGF